jgi:hypothetical protein
MTTITDEQSTKKTAILVCEHNGLAVIRYCTPQEASAACEAATVSCSGASMFTTDAAWDAELLMAISPNMKERVLEAQRCLQDDIKLRDLMDKHGIPRENALRASIKATFKDYIADSVQRALRH